MNGKRHVSRSGSAAAETVLVTGASSGIGEATVRALLAVGYVVYAGARRVERMQPLAEAGARLLELDVTEDTSMTAAVATILHETGRLDGLVNNAGYGSYGALEEVPLEEARHQFEVNIFGLARLTQLVLPTMRAQRSGKIVNISSVGGKFGGRRGPADIAPERRRRDHRESHASSQTEDPVCDGRRSEASSLPAPHINRPRL